MRFWWQQERSTREHSTGHRSPGISAMDPQMVDATAFRYEAIRLPSPDESASSVLPVSFDGPEPSFVTGDRDETNVPSQALLMLNSGWVTWQADEMAAMLLSLMPPTASDRTSLRTLGRSRPLRSGWPSVASSRISTPRLRQGRTPRTSSDSWQGSNHRSRRDWAWIPRRQVSWIHPISREERAGS